MANKTATLTHKVRNPQNLDSWLDIWSADVSADFDENDTRTNETVVITPSSNWEIPADKLTGTIPVTQISNVTSPAPTIEDPTKTETQKNVSITEPEGNHIAITNEDGSISEGPIFDPTNGEANEFLNGRGKWVTVETDVPFSVTVPTNTTNIELTVGEGDNEHTVTIKPQGKLSFEEGSSSNEIKLSLGEIETGDIKDGTIKLKDLDLTTLSDPTDPDSEKEFRLPAENIADIPATQITNFNTEVNNVINANTKDNAGIVAKGRDNTSKAWLTDSEQNPGWRKITADHMANELELDEKLKENSISGNKLNTKLLGVWIDDVSPIKYDVSKIVVTDTTYYMWSVTDTTTLQTVTFALTASPSTTAKGASWTVEVIWNNNELLTTITDQRDNNPLFNMESPATIFPKIQYILNDIQNNNSLFYIEFPSEATIEELKEFFKSSNFAQKLRNSLNNHINIIDGNATIEAVPMNDRLYIDNFIPEYMLSDWDYEHCGIWVQI